MYVCYALLSKGGKRTYVGVTNDPRRRLRQHRRELAGGARATDGAEVGESHCDRVLFAGEHASVEYQGSVCGALESGRRAAREAEACGGGGCVGCVVRREHLAKAAARKA